MHRSAFRLAPLIALALVASSCTSDGSGSSQPASSEPGEPLVLYSGRSEELVGPMIEQFTEATGIEVQVEYGGTTDLAAALLEEGDNSPADVFFAQDAGALGALAAEGMLASLPQDVLDRVDARFRSTDGEWIGASGRARVVAYNPDAVDPADLPDSIHGFVDPAWSDRIGWVPSNASFQAFITGMRVLEGDEAAREWLEGIHALDPVVYEGNGAALQGVADREVDVAFINHYYLMGQLAENPDFNAVNYFLPGGDSGALINIAGGAILASSDNTDAALAFIEYLVSDEAQAYFAEETYEYPLVAGIPADEELPPLADLQAPDIDLSDLADLEGTQELMREAGVL